LESLKLNLDIGNLEKMIINNYLENNFWKEHPLLKKMTPFNGLYKKDKRKEKDISSRMMWAIAAFVDISKKNLPEEEKISIIEQDYINVRFNKEELKECINKMRILLLSTEQRVLADLYDKLKERTKLIQDTNYTIENADKLDKLIGNTDNLITAIKKMETTILAGSDDGAVKGGRNESLSERNII